MAKLSVTNESIAKKLLEFDLPVFYGEIRQEEVETYNFFYYREESLEGNERYLVQAINVYYVSLNKDDLMEPQIIQGLKSIGLSFVRAVYDRLRIEKTDSYVDVVTFTFNRKMRLVCNG